MALIYEEMETVIIEVEAILNSKPIAPLSSDRSDELALNTGHCLIGEPLTTEVGATAQSLVKRWELLSRIKHKFWSRWSMKCLKKHQQLNKWQPK